MPTLLPNDSLIRSLITAFLPSFFLLISLIPAPILAAEVDLITNISSDKSAVVAGETVRYTTTVENRGPGTATNISWRIGIPSAESFSNENCSASGGAVCPSEFSASLLNLALGYATTVPSMPAGSTLTFTFDTIAKTAADDYKAVSQVTASSADTEVKPETDEADINISVIRSLLSYKVEKTFTRFENAAGSNVSTPAAANFAVFEVVVTNDGVDDLYGLKYREYIGVDAGNGTVPAIVGNPIYNKVEHLSGFTKDFYAKGTTLHSIRCANASNGATCPVDFVSAEQNFSEYIVVPHLPGRSRMAAVDPAGNPESAVTFEVKIKLGELTCSTVANSHRTLLTQSRLYGSIGAGENNTLGAPYGAGDSADNLVDVNQNITVPNCIQYDIATQLSEPVIQTTNGIDAATAFTYTVTMSNSGPDNAVDLPFYFGLYSSETDSKPTLADYDPLWSINNTISCTNTGGASCPTSYTINDHHVSGNPLSRPSSQHGLPDAQATIPVLPAGGTLTFTLTGTAGNLKSCGGTRYVNAHAHAMPLDPLNESNIEYPSASFESYYSGSGHLYHGYPRPLSTNGNYYGNNGFNLRTQWNTGTPCSRATTTYDLSTVMTGPFPDTTSTTPIAGPLAPGQRVYYRAQVANVDAGSDTLDFMSPISSNPLTEARAMLSLSSTLGYRSSHPDWLDFDTDESGWGTAAVDLYHPDDPTPSYGALLYEYPALATTPYGANDAESTVPWQVYLDVGLQCGNTTGGAACPDGTIGTNHSPYNATGMDLDGVQGHRGSLAIASDYYWHLEPDQGHSLDLPVGSSMEFVMPFMVPPAKVSCVEGGDLFTYTGTGFQAAVYGVVKETDDIYYEERNATNDKSQLTFQVAIPACTGSLEIDQRIVAPATNNILPADGIVRYEIDLTYPGSNSSALDVARFTDLAVPGCDSWSAGSTCANTNITDIVGCSVIAGTAACPPTIPIGQKRTQNGTLSTITTGTIDTSWGTPNASNVTAGAAFEPGSTVRITLEVQVQNSSTIFNEMAQTATFASDPNSSQYGPGLYVENTELLSIASKPSSMVLQQSVNPTAAVPGQSVTYTLEAINNGPINGQGATITGTLPVAFLDSNPSGYTNISCAPITTSPPLMAGVNIADCANINIVNNGAAGFRIDMADSWVINSGYRFTLEAIAPSGVTSVTNTAVLTPPEATSIQRFGSPQDSTANVWLAITELDYGDAPVYGTAPDGSNNNAYGQASHVINSGIYLGSGVPDADNAHQSSTKAYGDDADGFDDEDGVNMPALNPGATAAITVNATGAGGYLQGWIDWNGDGDFSDADEQIATDMQLTSGTTGTINVPVTVPASATTNMTFARFRWSTTAGLDSSHVAYDGEVEDYAVVIVTAKSYFEACTALGMTEIITPDGLEDTTFPRGYWAASYYEGHNGIDSVFGGQSGTGNSGSRVFHGEAFHGFGQNPVSITSNGNGSNNRWLQTETPTSPLSPPNYVGTTWASNGNPFYEINYRREIEQPGMLRFGYGNDELLDDTLEVKINGKRVFAHWPSSITAVKSPNSRPGQSRGVSIPLSPGDKVWIGFTNLGSIGGLSFQLDILNTDCSNSINGTVFEDHGFGGVSGHPYGTANTTGLGNTTVEVYNDGGNYLGAVKSSDNGSYALPGLINGNYYVRVVNNTVRSSRLGSNGNEIAIMTYRSNGSSATSTEVGGRYPKLVDAPTNDGDSQLNTGTFIFSGGSSDTQPAQSVQLITKADGKINNVNYGFNFNTIVNTNDSGQGSLQQFAQNNTILSGAGIAQQLHASVASDYDQGDTVAIFVIPSGQLNGAGEAAITTDSSLLINRPQIVIDGRLQTANTGRGLVVLEGKPNNSANGVEFFDADGAVLRDIAIRNFSGSGVVINDTNGASGTGVQIEQNTISNNGQYGVLLENNSAKNQIMANRIHTNGWAGIANDADPDNTFSQNSLANNGGLGIDLAVDGVTANSKTDRWLDYPDLTNGSINTNGSLVVAYDFDFDLPSNAYGYRVEFFSNDNIDPSGHGEGLNYLGYTDISPAGSGQENFKGSFNASTAVAENANIAATVLEKVSANKLGMTSEFSTINNGKLAVCTDLLSDPNAPLPTVSIDENSAVVTYLEARDINGDPITYTISNVADGRQFVINPIAPGALFDCLTIEFLQDSGIISTRRLSVTTTTAVMRAGQFAPAPGDYEAPTDNGGDNTYDLVITATDVTGAQVTKPLVLTVRDVNEKPLITTASNISYTERQNALVVDLEAYDPDAGDAEGSGLTYRISGGADAGQFMLDANTGKVYFNDTPDFDKPSDQTMDNRYELTVKVTDDEGYASNKNLLVTVSDDPANNGIHLSVHALLQGAYNRETGLMGDILRSKGILPATQPYQNEPFNHSGTEQVNRSLVAIEGNDAIVDWVLLELWSAADPQQIIAARAALIQRDGDLIDAETGATQLHFPTVKAGEYYLSLRHRNHLGVITVSPQALSGTENSQIDFSQPAVVLSGHSNQSQLIANDSEEGLALLWAGDLNHDNRLILNGTGNDLNQIFSQVLLAPQNTGFNSSYKDNGYYDTDLNLDGLTAFTGPNNDSNILLGNIYSHPANQAFISNYIVNGGLAP